MSYKHVPPALIRSSLTLAVAGLSGCFSSNPVDQTPTDAVYQGNTLADLESAEIHIEDQDLDNVSAEMALESYKRAVELFQDPEKRATSLRRMADLAMDSAEYQEIEIETRESNETAAAIDQDIDKMLYESFMESAKEAKNREEVYALLDLAGSMVPELDETQLETNYETAIVLYKSLIQNTNDPKEKAEAYYLLAKAYDLAGDLDSSIATLDELVTLYPNSTFYIEAQFRRAEMLFSFSDYDPAIEAYTEVIKSGTSSDFYEQALYKLGWSYYKLSDYQKSLAVFFTLTDHLHSNADLSEEKSMEYKLLVDTERAIGLSFTNMDGPESAKRYFARNGHRDYEDDIYRTLGHVYLAQERFRDAATTFDTFVDIYPEHPRAPEFSSLHIKAYEKGGFPSLVLPAKEKYIARYGIHSQFWSKYPGIRDQYVPLLKGHILDLATHNHAEAQKQGQQEGFEKAVGFYKEFLDTPPQDESSTEVRDWYAQALFSSKNFKQAISEFETVAYNNPNYARSSEAGYSALLAYQALIQTIPEKEEEQRSQLRDRKIASSLKFAERFREHKKVPQVLYNIVEDQLAQKDLQGAIKTAGMLVSRKPAAPEKLLRYGWLTIANAEFDLGRFSVAEFAYKKLLEFPTNTPAEVTKYKEQMAASVYKQGEGFEKQGDLKRAADTFLRVSEIYPEATVRKNADFDAATLYLRLEDYDTAVPLFEDFRKRYPDDELSETIPDKLAVVYEKTGNYTAAAQELELIAAKYAETDLELARQGLWKAAEMQDRAEKPAESIRLYKKYVWAHPEPYDFRSEAQFRLSNLYQELDDQSKHEFWLNELVKTYREAGRKATDRVAWLGAYGAFHLAEPKFEAFKAIKLTQPLKQSLARKTSAMKDALETYKAVSEIGIAEFSTASNYKTGELYRILAKDIMASERPKGLDEFALEEYEFLLEEQAFPYEDQAIDILIANADLTTKDIYGPWVKQSFSTLSKLLPGRYAKHEQVEKYVDIIY